MLIILTVLGPFLCILGVFRVFAVFCRHCFSSVCGKYTLAKILVGHSQTIDVREIYPFYSIGFRGSYLTWFLAICELHIRANILVGNTITRKIPFLQHHAHLCFQSSIQNSRQRLALSRLLHNAERLSDHILVTVMQGLPQLCQTATLCQHLVDSRRCLLHLCQTQQVHQQLNTNNKRREVEFMLTLTQS